MHNTPHTVSDVMTRNVLALKTGATFKDVVKAMREWKVSALPVVDDGHRVVGVVSEADLLLKEEFRDGDPDGYARPRRPEDVAKAVARTAEELMTAPAVTVRSGASLAQGARIMARNRVKRLPVVDGDGVLTGIVSRCDLLGVFLRDDADLAREVRRAVVERLVPETPGAIRVEVRDGIVKLTGRFRETGLAPVAAHLARAVEGVVDVDCALSGPHRHIELDPDLPDDTGAVTSPGTPPA
ncbi:CBS domain-containing protein [Streptomyces umbrinus]|uniref:CBS domain-containing protein n=1 Tax=Streptomyces umbrinus TaxID=67370 RepID=UPI0033D7672B